MPSIKTLIFMATMLFCAAAGGHAQKNTAKTRPPVFSSVYSDIAAGKSCRTIEAEFIRCRPVGDYRLFASSHNVSENVWIETRSGAQVTGLPSDKNHGISRNAGKFEWRLADGKPFAIIARFELLTMEDIEADRDLSSDRSKFAQLLIIKGLPGSEQLDIELDARLAANTNQKARDLADAAFMKKLELPLTEKDVSPRGLIAAQPDFTAGMSCVKIEKQFLRSSGEVFKSSKKGDLYLHETPLYTDYFSPHRSPVRYTFKTKKFEVFEGDTENHLWFEKLESSALLAADEALKFETVGREPAEGKIDGKTEKRDLIKIKVTGETTVGGYFDKAEAFLYVDPAWRNLVVKMELIFPDAARTCSLSGVSFNVPEEPFKLFDEYHP